MRGIVFVCLKIAKTLLKAKLRSVLTCCKAFIIPYWSTSREE
jgi:hypothetical protein